MHRDDAVREAHKIVHALEKASVYLRRFNEANAALHLDDQVLYSPLTAIVTQATASAVKVRDHLTRPGTTGPATPPQDIAGSPGRVVYPWACPSCDSTKVRYIDNPRRWWNAADPDADDPARLTLHRDEHVASATVATLACRDCGDEWAIPSDVDVDWA